MLQLTYISTTAPGLFASTLEQILLTSRRRNASVGLTGLLVFDGRRFLQALEGDNDAVNDTYARITRDTRHRAIVRLSSRIVEARDFGPWTMASQIAPPLGTARDIVSMIDGLTECVIDANARALFRSFARLQRAA